MKKRLYLISGFIILGVIIIFTIDKLSDDNISDENKSSFFVWSTGDCNGIYNVIGLHTISAIGYTSNQSIYPVDSMNNEKYFNLTYPIQVENIVYYTTINSTTGENCIIMKKNNEPQNVIYNNPKTGKKRRYYKRTNEWKVILSCEDEITYKCVVGKCIYYIVKRNIALNESECEIRCYDMENNSDKLLISHVHNRASFDVSMDGSILYVNENNNIILYRKEGNEHNLGIGTAACFGKDNCIIKVADSELKIVSLITQKEQKLCDSYGYDIKLSPSGTYVAIQYSYENKYGSGLENDAINVIDLSTGRIKEIDTASSKISGFAWFDDYYPIL